MSLKIGYQKLLDEAYAQVTTLGLDDGATLVGDDNVLFVDLRDVRELEREGMIPGAFHAPRGMLEFWIDPDCKYHKKELATDKRLILYCASAWRSALSAKLLQDMGVENVCHLEGGFSAWKKAGHPTALREKHNPKIPQGKTP